MVKNQTYGTDMDPWHRHGLMVYTWTHGIDMDSWYWQRLMVWKKTNGIDNTHGVDVKSWHSISTPESHTNKRAKCCPYAGFFFIIK